MAEQHLRPSNRRNAPDPSRAYERSHPELEAGMGRLDNNDDAVPAKEPDHVADAVHNRQDPSRQINAEDPDVEACHPQPLVEDKDHLGPETPDHSMLEEEPTDVGFAPEDIHNPRMKRHPRIGGKGGTPDVGEEDRMG